ncbi:methylated-DNA--[protein]-cysteine S-methyltransferase [Tunturiibacter lichenicola]|uniref:methylated-DNA--[protein]-cysteine S-methyltransferase n=1 Tax=Tunturiibacter lichenicola TaxID=2051959 RepID=UPI003D9B3F5F
MSEPLQLIIDRIATPIGEMIVIADHDGNLRAVDWADYEPRMQRLLQRHYGANGFKFEPGKISARLTEAINRYFAGDLAALDTLPVATSGTPFQRSVWRALRDIPFGTTITYAALAQKIGRPAAVRAVGLANGANPIGVIVPCHRVIGTNGSLTGYGGGIDRKRWLLKHESSPFSLEKHYLYLEP